MLKPIPLLLFIFALSQTSASNCSIGQNGKYCDECGKTSSSRIIGGLRVDQGKWPSLVLIDIEDRFNKAPNGRREGNEGPDDHNDSSNDDNNDSSNDDNNDFSNDDNHNDDHEKLEDHIEDNRGHSYCLGVLIDRSTVLTVAHCFDKKGRSRSSISRSYHESRHNKSSESFRPCFQSEFRVYLGVKNISSIRGKNVQAPASLAYVNKIIKHAEYDPVTRKNDIALLILSSEVSLSSSIQISCLPSSKSDSYPGIDVNGFVVGWGAISSNYTAKNSTLNEAEITLNDASLCSSVQPSYGKNSSNQICAGSNTKGACNGDDGAPLFVSGSVNGVSKYVAVGLSSYFSTSCDSLQVYTRISQYVDWIIANSDAISTTKAVTTIQLYNLVTLTRIGARSIQNGMNVTGVQTAIETVLTNLYPTSNISSSWASTSSSTVMSLTMNIFETVDQASYNYDESTGLTTIKNALESSSAAITAQKPSNANIKLDTSQIRISSSTKVEGTAVNNIATKLANSFYFILPLLFSFSVLIL